APTSPICSSCKPPSTRRSTCSRGSITATRSPPTSSRVLPRPCSASLGTVRTCVRPTRPSSDCSRRAPMNSRFTVRQIAEALGVDLSTAKRRAARERWPYEEATGRGGRRRLYPLEGLPDTVQVALLRRYPDLAAHRAETTHRTHHYDPEELARWAES